MPTTAQRTAVLLNVLTVALVVAAVATYAGYERLGGLASFAIIGVSWGCFVVCLAGLILLRPPLARVLRFTVASIGFGALADTLLALSGHPGDYDYPPVLVGYLLCYALGGWAMIRILRLWPRGHHIGIALDSAMLAVSVAIVLGSLAADGLADPAVPSDAKVWAVVFLAINALLVAAIARVWFLQAKPSTAWRLFALSPVFGLLQNAVDVVGLSRPDALPPVAGEVWSLTFVTLACAMTRPSLVTITADEPEPVDVTGSRHAVAPALSLAVPALVVVGFGLAGWQLPWQPVGIGGLITAALVAARVALLLRAVRRQRQASEEMARSDALTGVANRRRWDHALADALTAADAPGRVWVALIDLDRFKPFNDTYGHAAGDQLLRTTVTCWSRAIPESALLARYGGDEFAVLLTVPGHAEADRAYVVEVLEAIRAVTPEGHTCSIGTAVLAPGETADGIMRRADDALYAAKRNGRDQLSVARPGPGRAVIGQVLPDGVTIVAKAPSTTS